MKTLLVPTDFSPAGRNATDYAAALARHFSAKLVLFHAYMVPTPVSEVPYAMATVEDLQQQHEADIRKEANYLSKNTASRPNGSCGSGWLPMKCANCAGKRMPTW